MPIKNKKRLEYCLLAAIVWLVFVPIIFHSATKSADQIQIVMIWICATHCCAHYHITYRAHALARINAFSFLFDSYVSIGQYTKCTHSAYGNR